MNNELFSHKSVRIGLVVFLSLASLFLAVKTIASVGAWHRGSVSADTPKISVSGSGEAFAVPTTATFSFSVMETASTVSVAQNQATARTNKALEYLKKAGVPEKDIKTLDYNVYPQYSYTSAACTSMMCPPSRQILTGYQVSQTVQVKVTDPAKAGELLAGIGSLGVQNISSLSFTVEDDTAIMREAREKAITEAREKAEMLAQDLGVHLGRIVDFQESNNVPGPVYYAKDSLQSAGANVAPAPELPAGQNKVTSNVTIVYEIR